MERIQYYLLLVFAAVLFFNDTVNAQGVMEKFGRNRIQYEQFDWKYLSSDNFDVYFYDGGDKVASEVTEYLEEQFERVTDIIGYPPYSKTKLFLYNSVSDLQQSNVGIDDNIASSGGETQFVKSHIEMAHPGDLDALKEELLYKVTSLMVNEMMFGGSLKEMFQSSVLLNLPDWFINGASLYVSKGWSIEMDDYARELVSTKHAKKFSKLTGREAALAGQSLWNFIAEKYGRSNISNILNYTRIIRNEEKSMAITLGVSFEQLMYEWKNFYLEIEQEVNGNYQGLDENNRIEKKNKKNYQYSGIALSPDGQKAAYAYNYRGKYYVIFKDLATGTEKHILSGGGKVINQEIDITMPLVDWVDDNTIGIIDVKKGRLRFILHDINTNSQLPRWLDKFEQIHNVSFSDNGRLMIISAVVDGMNDLYLLSTRRDRIKRLTYDIYDDIQPAFLPNSNTFVFSSNRVSDTLNLKDKDFENISDNFNLFFFNLDTTTNVVHRVTNTISRDVQPKPMSDNKIYYLSDQKGIVNLFSYDIASSIYTQVTNFSSSIENYDIDFNNSRLVFISDSHGRDYIYDYPNFNFDQQIFTPLTRRQQVLQVKAFKQKRSTERKEALTVKEIVEQRLEEAREKAAEQELDTFKVEDGVIDTDNYQFGDSNEPEEKGEDIINTDNYTFDNDVVKDKEPDSFLAQYRKLRKGNKITGPFPYDSRFSADNLVTTLVVDPLRGFGVLMETEMTDMLENHKFSGGIMAAIDLRSGDIFAEYKYLKNRMDYSARYDRTVIFRDSDMLHRYTKNQFGLGVAYPFSPRTRIGLKPFYAITRFDNLEPRLVNNITPVFDEPQSEQYGGASIELVYDNSVINGMNLIEGSRAKFQLNHYEGISDQLKSFTHISADIRHYQKIYKEIVLAGRLYYGTFFGKSPKQYLLGGMDNWLFFDENDDEGSPLHRNREKDNSDLLFVKYATNLRGFDYGTLFGQSTLLFNAELRVPLVRALSSGPISSNFLRNLQFIGFFDIGSAWTGESPFSDDNSISTKVIKDRNFTIELENFRSPWIYSYGPGLRTILLGYYIKFDLAWPVDNYQVGSPRLHLTLGYDF